LFFLKANPAGVVTVVFSEIDQADACCQYMNGRIWHGRVIECKTWDGKKFFFIKTRIKIWCFLGSTKYDAAPPTEEEKERIDEWHKFLTEDGDDQEEI